MAPFSLGWLAFRLVGTVSREQELSNPDHEVDGSDGVASQRARGWVNRCGVDAMATASSRCLNQVPARLGMLLQ